MCRRHRNGRCEELVPVASLSTFLGRPWKVALRCASQPGTCALGLAFALASGLPIRCHGALSISSGYEDFLAHIRQRIVCEESDVFDEAEQKGSARPCDSMKDGPFCRGLPNLDVVARHRPFTVDSIVPQHIFGNARAVQEFSGMEGDDPGMEPRGAATATLNKFLEKHLDIWAPFRRPAVVEGRLDLGQSLLMRTKGLPSTFSRGLPHDIIATWDGAWQVLPVAEVDGPSGKAEALLRLNGAVGVLRFSRPVVVRHLVVRPPLHATSGVHRIFVHGRKAGMEVWRSAYDYDGTVGVSSPLPCSIGDVVIGKWGSDGNINVGSVLVAHETVATVRCFDDNQKPKRVMWRNLATSDGVSCLVNENLARGTAHIVGTNELAKNNGHIGARQAYGGGAPSVWRDLARRVRTVDEVSFMVASGAEGWLLADLVVSTVLAPHKKRASDVDEEPSTPLDPSTFMVQVHPGPRAVITELSSAAVLYDSDDMLVRGLRLRNTPWKKNKDAAGSSVSQKSQGREEAKRLLVSSSRSTEGFKQLLRALELPDNGSSTMLRLPPHVRPEQFLEESERLIAALDVSKTAVQKYSHFEVFFTSHWDWLTPVDALKATFERWRIAPATQLEAQGSFYLGQQWSGVYFCTQGQTVLNLNITNVTTENGQDFVTADLTFRISDRKLEGAYSVTGKVQPEGRVLVLDPVQGSWKNQPKNFVMAGLQGVVSVNPRSGGFRYAGTVPIIGCDSFLLESLVSASPVPPDPSLAPTVEEAPSPVQTLANHSPEEHRRLTWNAALVRFANALEMIQIRWQTELQFLIKTAEDSTSKKDTSQFQQILEAARTSGLVSLELTMQDGEQVVVKLGR